MKGFVVVIGLLVNFLMFVSGAAAEPRVVPGEFIIKYTKGITATHTKSLREGLRVKKLKALPRINAEVVRSVGSSYDHEFAKKLLATGTVEYIEPNYIYTIDSVPNDPQFDALWGLHNTGQDGGTNDVDIDGPEAWNTTTGSEQVVVGVIDTGVNYNHPDLAANIWVNPGEIPNNGVDDDQNGVVDDIHGFNAVYGTGDPLDDQSHGSHCSGTIGGVGNNGSGVVGVNWRVKIMGLKFLDADGSGSTDDAVSAIDYAITMKNRGVNIKVLSNSWGGGGFSQALKEAIDQANAAGMIFIAAAGNESSNNDQVENYPSNYDVPNVVAVAAVDRNGNLADFSNYGATTVDLAAPGVDILSTVLGAGFDTYSGTSMATPHVSGIAGLIVAQFPALTPSQMKAKLLDAVKPLAGLNGYMVRPGIISAALAIGTTVPPAPPAPPAPPTPPSNSGNYSRIPVGYAFDSHLGSRVLLADDQFKSVNLGFTFPFYGTGVTKLALSSNGRILPLRSGDSVPTEADYQNQSLPGISVYHDDHVPSESTDTGVWFKSSDQVAFITWVARSYAHRFDRNPVVEIRVQAKLFASGEIQFHYGDTNSGDSSFDYGASATVGVAPLSGQEGSAIVVSDNNANAAELGTGKAIGFSLSHGPVPADFDGDGRSDIYVWRPSMGMWFIALSSANFNLASHQMFQLGLAGDIPLVGHFDSDARTDLAVWRPSNGTWYFRTSGSGYSSIVSLQWGLPGDIPLVGDYDGDGLGDIAAYRQSSGMFYVLLSSGGYNRDGALVGLPSTFAAVHVGGLGNDPVVGDFTGEGKDTFVTVWQLIRFWTGKNISDQMLFSAPWGEPGDRPLACDWDGDGASDRVAVRPTPAGVLQWFIATANGGGFTLTFGLNTDIPKCDRDYDGDGQADPTVFRQESGTWYAKKSSTGGMLVVPFGLYGDIVN